MAGGKSYFLNEPQGLEQILLKDVMEYTGSTAVERALKPIVDTKAEVLDGTDIESAPALKGYTRFGQTDSGDCPVDRPGTKRSIVRSLAVRVGANRRVYVRCEEPVGVGVDELAGLRQVLD